MVRGKSISEDVRNIIVRLSNSGKSYSEIGNLLNVSKYSVANIIQLYNRTGAIVKKPKLGKKSGILEVHKRTLRRIISKNRRCSYGDLSILWTTAIGRKMSKSTCHRTASKM